MNKDARRALCLLHVCRGHVTVGICMSNHPVLVAPTSLTDTVTIDTNTITITVSLSVSVPFLPPSAISSTL